MPGGGLETRERTQGIWTVEEAARYTLGEAMKESCGDLLPVPRGASRKGK